MIPDASYEEVVREWSEAHRAMRAGFRASLAAQHATLDKDAEAALWSRYCVEHAEEADRVDRLATEVDVARAALERRWIEAHEDLRLLAQRAATQ